MYRNLEHAAVALGQVEDGSWKNIEESTSKENY